MSDLAHSVPHDGTDAEARPVFTQERRILGVRASSWPGIIAPVVIGILALAAWELTVRLKGIPHYILPGPLRPGKLRLIALTVTCSRRVETPGPAAMQAPHDGSMIFAPAFSKTSR